MVNKIDMYAEVILGHQISLMLFYKHVSEMLTKNYIKGSRQIKQSDSTALSQCYSRPIMLLQLPASLSK